MNIILAFVALLFVFLVSFFLWLVAIFVVAPFWAMAPVPHRQDIFRTYLVPKIAGYSFAPFCTQPSIFFWRKYFDPASTGTIEFDKIGPNWKRECLSFLGGDANFSGHMMSIKINDAGLIVSIVASEPATVYFSSKWNREPVETRRIRLILESARRGKETVFFTHLAAIGESFSAFFVSQTLPAGVIPFISFERRVFWYDKGIVPLSSRRSYFPNGIELVRAYQQQSINTLIHWHEHVLLEGIMDTILAPKSWTEKIARDEWFVFMLQTRDSGAILATYYFELTGVSVDGGDSEIIRLLAACAQGNRGIDDLFLSGFDIAIRSAFGLKKAIRGVSIDSVSLENRAIINHLSSSPTIVSPISSSALNIYHYNLDIPIPHPSSNLLILI